MMGIIAASGSSGQTISFVLNNSIVVDGDDINPTGAGQIKLNLETNPSSTVDCVLTGGATETQSFTANFFNHPVFTFTGASSNINGEFISSSPIIGVRLQSLGMESIVLSNAPDLIELFISGNDLTTVSVANNPLLTSVYVASNSLNSTSVDNIYIDLDNHGLSNGILQIDSGTRTSNSDTAVANLTAKGWSFF